MISASSKSTDLLKTRNDEAEVSQTWFRKLKDKPDMAKNTGGRPTQYPVDQIRAAIRSLLGEGL